MLSRTCLGVGVWLIMGAISALQAQEQPSPPQLSNEYPYAIPTPIKKAADKPRYEVIQPCLGRGYIPYSYPAIDSCPCARQGCYHPCRYYCGGKEYHRDWRSRWLRAHLGLGSMLDGYCWECLFPTTGRPYWRTVTSTPSSQSNSSSTP